MPGLINKPTAALLFPLDFQTMDGFDEADGVAAFMIESLEHP